MDFDSRFFRVGSKADLEATGVRPLKVENTPLQPDMTERSPHSDSKGHGVLLCEVSPGSSSASGSDRHGELARARFIPAP